MAHPATRRCAGTRSTGRETGRAPSYADGRACPDHDPVIRPSRSRRDVTRPQGPGAGPVHSPVHRTGTEAPRCASRAAAWAGARPRRRRAPVGGRGPAPGGTGGERLPRCARGHGVVVAPGRRRWTAGRAAPRLAAAASLAAGAPGRGPRRRPRAGRPGAGGRRRGGGGPGRGQTGGEHPGGLGVAGDAGAGGGGGGGRRPGGARSARRGAGGRRCPLRDVDLPALGRADRLGRADALPRPAGAGAPPGASAPGARLGSCSDGQTTCQTTGRSGQLASASLARIATTALVCIWHTRDSVTPRTLPISDRVRFS